MATLTCLKCGKEHKIMLKNDFKACDCGAILPESTLESIQDIALQVSELQGEIRHHAGGFYGDFNISF